jgi:hypothetical protein
MMPNKPKPFSSEWINAPAVSADPPRRLRQETNARIVSAFSRLPGERVLMMLVVLFLITASFWFTGPAGGTKVTTEGSLVASLPDRPVIQFMDPEPTEEADISTDALQIREGDAQEDGSTPVVPDVSLAPAPEVEQPTTPGGLLPSNRVLSFYGFPGNPDMGILGEYDMQRLLELLREQAAEYERADPSRPVLLAFEVIASVAQQYPLLDTPSDVLDEYTEFTRENGLLLILDAQIGYRTVENDVKGLRPWLEEDHVHLAIDPEFAMGDGEIPGIQIGGVDAVDVQWAQQFLVDLAYETGITPKILIVHQFTENMIMNKGRLTPVRGVQLVVDADGFGDPDLKRATYDIVNKQTLVEYAGIKLFYTRDIPIMTAEEVVALDPPPLFVMYQ